MAEKKNPRNFDVWIVETNTVYKQVPFSVITDWVQQGRLLGEDKLRLAPNQGWILLGKVPQLAVYLPRVEPYRVEDQAEALEPVQVDFSWKRRSGEDDDQDVDMIPLIDISLVLLIFFMMTAAVGPAASLISVPEAKHKLLEIEANTLWLGIDQDGNFSLGEGDKGASESFGQDREKLLQALRKKLENQSNPMDIRIRAHRDLAYVPTVRDMMAELEKLKSQGKVANIRGEVSEKRP